MDLRARSKILSYALVLGMLSSLTPLLMVGTAPVAEASPDPGWYDPNWTYRRPITINNPGSALTDYQVLVTNPVYDETGLVGSWHFNEGSGTTAYDSSGRGNDGTLVNGPIWVDGKYGKALRFDGVDDYVDCGNDASLKTPSGNTVEAWVYFNDVNNAATLISKDDDTNRDYLISLPTAGKLRAHIRTTGGFRHIDFISSVTTGKWYYVAQTYDGSVLKLYINGTLDKSGTFNESIVTTGAKLTIGRRECNKWGYQPLNGLIDEVRIYNRALSAEEIKAHYEAKARLDYGDIRFTDSDGTTSLNYWMESDGKFWVKVPSIPGSGTKTIYAYYGNPGATSASSAANTFVRVIDGAQLVVGSWHFDEGCGTTAYDGSGRGNNGTLVNGPAWVEGKYGRALQFDGVDDYVDCGSGTSLDVNTITVEAWVKWTGGANTYRTILSKMSSSNPSKSYNLYTGVQIKKVLKV